MSERIFAFTDESGAFGFAFDKPGVTTHFIITSIIVKENNLDQVREQVEYVRKKYFQTGEMKSSSIKNHERRKKIIEDLLAIDFKIFAVAFDKRQIAEWKGLQYKTSFYKFLNNIVHKELRRAFPMLTVCSDEIGGSEYMQSFSRYIMNHTDNPSLFGDVDFSFLNSQNEVLIQLADLISGTLGFIYDDKKKKDGNPDYYSILSSKIIRVEPYPKTYETYSVNTSALAEEYNEKIAKLCLKQAVDFIDKHTDDEDDEVQAQIIVLKYLLFRFMNNDTRKYVSTEELKGHLKGIYYLRKNRELSTRVFRTRIIGKLRDAGVIISSSSVKKGYKIPANESELYDFVNHDVDIIMPMLARLKKCRDLVKLGTLNEIDLFDKTEISSIRKIFDN